MIPSEKQEKIRLNKFIASAGVCSRRSADKLILEGKVSVNGKKITTLGYSVSTKDTVTYNGKALSCEKHVYILLNKPKGFITTASDPEDRKTVIQLIKNACKERVYPVGRLDRNTTGLLLLTNDGDLARGLSHPSSNVSKIYQVTIDKKITEEDLTKIAEGLSLEDGKAIVDEVAVVDESKKVLGLQLHLGKNRIIRRIFEHLGYNVEKLDRVLYACLTKKNIKRGSWRMLAAKEVRALKNACKL